MKTPFERSQVILNTFGPNLVFSSAIQKLTEDSIRLEKLQGSLYAARDTITDWAEVTSDIVKERREINIALMTASETTETLLGVSA